jgi:phosphoacetylglucosamine mutase
MITYDTAGFRYDENIIKKYAYRIGLACAYCSYITHAQIGIMITASHNKYTDNGIKIVMYNGEYLTKELEDVVTDIVNGRQVNTIPTFGFVIGRDTRRSGYDIQSLIIDGIMNVSYCYPNIQRLCNPTTPELHYYTTKYPVSTYDYALNYRNLYLQLNPIPITVVNVDCANGVGTYAINRLCISKLKCINNQTIKYSQLNYLCGSDFVLTTNHLPTNTTYFNGLIACFDGDADRIIFINKYNNNFSILDGDYISALICLYLTQINCEFNICIVHTAYSNNAFIDYIKSINKNIIFRCTPTGVKHLHAEAKKYDIGIYFETNGHGTVLATNNVLSKFPILKLFNQLVGDSVANLLAIMTILDSVNCTINQWSNLFIKYPNILSIINVKDRSIFVVDEKETTLIEPKFIQTNIDQILNSFDIKCRAFVRPSGTEDLLRLYVEVQSNSNNELTLITNEIIKNIKNQYN